MPWYVYDAAALDVSNPNNYGPALSTPPTCPNPKNFLCAVQTNDISGSPDLTSFALMVEIANAINNRLESTNVKLRPTR